MKKRRIPRSVAWGVLIVLATAAVWQRYTIVSLGDEVEDLQQEITDLERARDQLLAETALLSSRARIETIAVQHLGMTPTHSSQLRQLPLRSPQSSERGGIAGPE